METNREYQGKVIKKELLFSGNYKLIIQTKEGKIKFCYTKRFEAKKHILYLEELREKETQELKARQSQGLEREELTKWFLEKEN